MCAIRADVMLFTSSRKNKKLKLTPKDSDIVITTKLRHLLMVRTFIDYRFRFYVPRKRKSLPNNTIKEFHQ